MSERTKSPNRRAAVAGLLLALSPGAVACSTDTPKSSPKTTVQPVERLRTPQQAIVHGPYLHEKPVRPKYYDLSRSAIIGSSQRALINELAKKTVSQLISDEFYSNNCHGSCDREGGKKFLDDQDIDTGRDIGYQVDTIKGQKQLSVDDFYDPRWLYRISFANDTRPIPYAAEPHGVVDYIRDPNTYMVEMLVTDGGYRSTVTAQGNSLKHDSHTQNTHQFGDESLYDYTKRLVSADPYEDFAY